MFVNITSAINFLFVFCAKNVCQNCCSSVQDGSGVTHILYSNEIDDSDTHGICEYYPGFNPSSERIVELRSDIHEKVEELVKNLREGVPEDIVTAISEDLHGESNDADFLQTVLNDLNRGGATDPDFQNSFQKLVAHMGPTIPSSSPLDQFEIVPLIPMDMGNLYFSFTNPSLFMLLTLILFLLLVYFVTKKGGGKLVPNAWQSLVELIYDFVLNPVNEQIGGLSSNVKQKYFPCISVTFTFSLFRNPQGDLGPLFIVLALTVWKVSRTVIGQENLRRGSKASRACQPSKEVLYLEAAL
ncbi:hypothetical protein V6N13_057138 [Hibiscus sabdariffa]